MPGGMFGRLNERARKHLKHSSSPIKEAFHAGRAPTPSAVASPRSTRSPRKHLFARSTLTKAAAALRSAKSRETLRPEPQPVPGTIFSSPIRVQLDSKGEPACVRYIAHYLCDHTYTEQHPCDEHNPAFCLDLDHCVARKMEKRRKCYGCEQQEVAKMLVDTAQSFPARPMGVEDQPMKHSSPSRVAHAVIKSRIAKRIAELGPLGEARSSPLSVRQDEAESIVESVAQAKTAKTNRLLSLAESVKDEDIITRTIVEKSTVAAVVPPLTTLPPAVIALKKRLDGQVAGYRAVSEAHRAATVYQDQRVTSASLRPLPPLPTPVNFEGFADKTFRRASASSQLPVDPHHGSEFSCGQKRYEDAEDVEATFQNNLDKGKGVDRTEFAGTPPNANTFETPFDTPPYGTPEHQKIQFASGVGQKYVHFLAGDVEALEHDSTLLEGEDSDISTLNLDNSADNDDPFLNSVTQQMATLSVSPRTERPLPPIPSSRPKRNSLPSSVDGLDTYIETAMFSRRASQHEGLQKRIMSSKRISMQNFEPSANQLIQSSPTPNKAPKLPTSQDAFAAFDFHLGYERGKIGYIGRMGQKGSGDDFNRDWKTEYGSRDYAKDETATGDLWENKHGFGYAGLKRYLNKLNDERKKKDAEDLSKKGQSGSPGKMMARDESVNFSSPRPNKESTVWARRWSRNVGIPIPGPVLNFKGLKTDINAIVKKEGDATHLILKTARKEKYKDVPWDRTMIGCAL